MTRPPQAPLEDRIVVVGLVATLGIVFALVFWTVRFAPPADGPLQWRQPSAEPGLTAPAPTRQDPATGRPAGLPAGGSTI